jgi:hypothetical protein
MIEIYYALIKLIIECYFLNIYRIQKHVTQKIIVI